MVSEFFLYLCAVQTVLAWNMRKTPVCLFVNFVRDSQKMMVQAHAFDGGHIIIALKVL